jgi:hypothetical protein
MAYLARGKNSCQSGRWATPQGVFHFAKYFNGLLGEMVLWPSWWNILVLQLQISYAKKLTIPITLWELRR